MTRGTGARAAWTDASRTRRCLGAPLPSALVSRADHKKEKLGASACGPPSPCPELPSPAASQHPAEMEGPWTERGLGSGDVFHAAVFLIAVKSPNAPWLLSACLAPRPGREVLVTAIGLGGRALLPGEACTCCCSHLLLALPCAVCTADTEPAAAGPGAVSGWLCPALSSPPGGAGVGGEPHD